MRRLLLFACAFALPAFAAAEAACPPDEAVERLALGILDNRPGEPLPGMSSWIEAPASSIRRLLR